MPKIKYSEEIKIKAVKEILENNKSQKQVSKEYCIGVGDIQKWLAAYRENGEEGLQIRQNNHQKYDGNFKLKVVKYKQENRLSARQTAAYFNIATYTSVCQWEKKYIEGGVKSLLEEKRGSNYKMPKKTKTPKTHKSPQTQTEKELLEKIRILEMENEYLKKLNALVQQRKK